MTENWSNEIYLEYSGRDVIDVIFYLGGSSKNHEPPSQDSRCPVQDVNLVPA